MIIINYVKMMVMLRFVMNMKRIEVWNWCNACHHLVTVLMILSFKILFRAHEIKKK